MELISLLFVHLYEIIISFCGLNQRSHCSISTSTGALHMFPLMAFRILGGKLEAASMAITLLLSCHLWPVESWQRRCSIVSAPRK